MDQTEVGLKSVTKSLLDTVAPSIDPSDHLAKEQLRLAVGYIDFVRQRLHLIHARERLELDHYVGLGGALLAMDLPAKLDAMPELRTSVTMATALLANPATLTGDIRAAAVEVARAVACVVENAHAQGLEQAGRIDAAVLAASETKLEFERLWYQPIGFDPSPPKDRRLEDYFT